MIRRDKNRKPMKRRAYITAMMSALCCMAFLSACGSKEEEIPMGRYADREVKLPPGTFDYMHPCTDGS